MHASAEDAVGRIFLKGIIAQSKSGNFSFPTSARLAIRVARAVNDPDCTPAEAARLLQAEPLLATKVVALANSAAYDPFDRPVADMLSAVQRIGLRMIQALATAVACQQMAGDQITVSRQRLSSQLWEHSTHVAALACVIARRLTRQPPETALFAGMVHELGAFYLLSRCREFPDLSDAKLASLLLPVVADKADDADEADEFDNCDCLSERTIGHAVLSALCVPAPVLTALEVLWQGFLAVPPETMGDTLLLADQLASIRSPFSGVWGQRRNAPRADLNMLVGEETLVAVLERSAGEVDSLMAALRI